MKIKNFLWKYRFCENKKFLWKYRFYIFTNYDQIFLFSQKEKFTKIKNHKINWFHFIASIKGSKMNPPTIKKINIFFDNIKKFCENVKVCENKNNCENVNLWKYKKYINQIKKNVKIKKLWKCRISMG